MVEFIIGVQYKIIRGNKKLKAGEKLIVYDSEPPSLPGYILYVYPHDTGLEDVRKRSCYQFYGEQSADVFEKMLEGLEITPDKDFGLKRISELERDIDTIRSAYGVAPYERARYGNCTSTENS